MTDRLNELNDKIIENLEKQVANYEEIIKIDNTTISNLSNKVENMESEVSRYKAALELASDKLSALESKYAKDGLQKFAAEFSRIKSKITQALEKEEK